MSKALRVGAGPSGSHTLRTIFTRAITTPGSVEPNEQRRSFVPHKNSGACSTHATFDMRHHYHHEKRIGTTQGLGMGDSFSKSQVSSRLSGGKKKTSSNSRTGVPRSKETAPP